MYLKSIYSFSLYSLSLLVLIAICSCSIGNIEKHEKYYLKVYYDESSLEFKGFYEIEASQVNYNHYYSFKSDDSGRIVNITEFYRGRIKSSGLLVNYNYKDNFIDRKYENFYNIDKSGLSLLKSPPILTESDRIITNKNGKLKSIFYYDSTGEMSSSFKAYELLDVDSIGRIISRVSYHKDGELSYSNPKIVYKYKNNTSLISELLFYDKSYNKKFEFKKIEKFEYDSIGNCIELSFYDENHFQTTESKESSTYSYIYKYDNKGNLILLKELSLDGKIIEEIVLNYNEYSDVIDRKVIDQDGNLSTKSKMINNKSATDIPMINALYDSLGNATQIKYFGRDEKLIKYHYKYDFDKDDYSKSKYIIDSTAVVRYFYNDDNELFLKKSYDRNMILLIEDTLNLKK